MKAAEIRTLNKPRLPNKVASGNLMTCTWGYPFRNMVETETILTGFSWFSLVIPGKFQG
jgi:hypothetical protein